MMNINYQKGIIRECYSCKDYFFMLPFSDENICPCCKKKLNMWPHNRKEKESHEDEKENIG